MKNELDKLADLMKSNSINSFDELFEYEDVPCEVKARRKLIHSFDDLVEEFVQKMSVNDIKKIIFLYFDNVNADDFKKIENAQPIESESQQC